VGERRRVEEQQEQPGDEGGHGGGPQRWDEDLLHLTEVRV
jgi:hypothetical protein